MNENYYRNLLWSHETPIVLANYALNPAPFNSVKENPLPTLTLILYFLVQALTTGLNIEVGLGQTLLAFARLA